MRLNIFALIGLISVWVVILTGIFITGVGFLPFISIPSIFIVAGGVFTILIVASPKGFVRNFFVYIRACFSNKDFNKIETINLLVSFSNKARRDGLLALEDNLVDIENQHMRKGIQMVIDGTDPIIIKRTLLIEQDEVRSRHEKVQNTFAFLERISPSFGLIGTVIGLIALLGNIGGDPASIGLGMQTALVTTLYGTLFANVFFAPIRNRLVEQDVEEFLVYDIILEGVLGIQSGDNPRILKDRLYAFLSSEEKEKVYIDEER